MRLVSQLQVQFQCWSSVLDCDRLTFSPFQSGSAYSSFEINHFQLWNSVKFSAGNFSSNQRQFQFISAISVLFLQVSSFPVEFSSTFQFNSICSFHFISFQLSSIHSTHFISVHRFNQFISVHRSFQFNSGSFQFIVHFSHISCTFSSNKFIFIQLTNTPSRLYNSLINSHHNP